MHIESIIRSIVDRPLLAAWYYIYMPIIEYVAALADMYDLSIKLDISKNKIIAGKNDLQVELSSSVLGNITAWLKGATLGDFTEGEAKSVAIDGRDADKVFANMIKRLGVPAGIEPRTVLRDAVKLRKSLRNAVIKQFNRYANVLEFEFDNRAVGYDFGATESLVGYRATFEREVSFPALRRAGFDSKLETTDTLKHFYITNDQYARFRLEGELENGWSYDKVGITRPDITVKELFKRKLNDYSILRDEEGNTIYD